MFVRATSCGSTWYDVEDSANYCDIVSYPTTPNQAIGFAIHLCERRNKTSHQEHANSQKE